MDSIKFFALSYNFIIYIIMVFPIIVICLNNKIYKSKTSFIYAISLSVILEILFSLIVYAFPRKIFSIFSNSNGIINYSVYASKILFISSSLYGIKFLIPSYLFNKKMKKKSAILVLSKIAVLIIFILIGYNLFNIKEGYKPIAGAVFGKKASSNTSKVEHKIEVIY